MAERLTCIPSAEITLQMGRVEPAIRSAELDFSQDLIKVPLPEQGTLTAQRIKKAGENLPDDVRKWLVETSRTSYKKWGEDIPLTDPDDLRSTWYLGIACYWDEQARQCRSEAVSMRLITANGHYGQDIDHTAFYAKHRPNDPGVPLRKVLTENFQVGHQDLGAVSRIAKFPSPHKLRYFGEAFNLIRLMMAQEAEQARIQYIVMRHQPYIEELSRIAAFRPKFTPAIEALGWQHLGQIRHYREDPQAFFYALQYPGYFFEIEDLKSALEETLGPDFAYQGVAVRDLKPKNIKQYKDLFLQGETVVVHEKDSQQITAGKIRAVIYDVNRVKDGMRLSMMGVKAWEKMSREMLNYQLWLANESNQLSPALETPGYTHAQSFNGR